MSGEVFKAKKEFSLACFGSFLCTIQKLRGFQGCNFENWENFVEFFHADIHGIFSFYFMFVVDNALNNILNEANILINFIAKQTNQIESYLDSITALLDSLEKLGLFGPYSVLSYFFSAKKKNTLLSPLPIDFSYGTYFESMVNMEFIEQYLNNAGANLLLWSYNVYFNDEFVSLATNYVSPSSKNFKQTYQYVIQQKLLSTQNINNTLAVKYGEMINIHFSELKTVTNFYQIMNGEDFNILDRISFFKFLFKENEWFYGQDVEASDDIFSTKIKIENSFPVNDISSKPVEENDTNKKSNLKIEKRAPCSRKRPSMSKHVSKTICFNSKNRNVSKIPTFSQLIKEKDSFQWTPFKVT